VRVLKDDPVDQVFQLLQRAAVGLHKRLREEQNGKLRRYAGWMMAGSLATILAVVFS